MVDKQEVSVLLTDFVNAVGSVDADATEVEVSVDSVSNEIRLYALGGVRSLCFTMLASSEGSGVTELLAGADGDTMPIPVPSTMVANEVAVSWMSDSAPAGDWTATLQRRQPGGQFTDVGTFTVSTS